MTATMRRLSFTAKGYNQLTPVERVSHARDTYGATRVIVRTGEAPAEPVDGVIVTTDRHVPAGHLRYSTGVLVAPVTEPRQAVLP